jgi:hypothetical protein
VDYHRNSHSDFEHRFRVEAANNSPQTAVAGRGVCGWRSNSRSLGGQPEIAPRVRAEVGAALVVALVAGNTAAAPADRTVAGAPAAFGVLEEGEEAAAVEQVGLWRGDHRRAGVHTGRG